eukprot:TRINITY_DN3838_c0_g1_i2.p1 TRINITY_DN3838_c0_g1~~TRINITY_DN3838_c0_g1_i2.p1  ORF type:complete len:259 (-),score=62.30 TRINITY_DN3838_c0_g1_i2:107-883(-)
MCIRDRSDTVEFLKDIGWLSPTSTSNSLSSPSPPPPPPLPPPLSGKISPRIMRPLTVNSGTGDILLPSISPTSWSSLSSQNGLGPSSLQVTPPSSPIKKSLTPHSPTSLSIPMCSTSLSAPSVSTLSLFSQSSQSPVNSTPSSSPEKKASWTSSKKHGRSASSSVHISSTNASPTKFNGLNNGSYQPTTQNNPFPYEYRHPPAPPNNVVGLNNVSPQTYYNPYMGMAQGEIPRTPKATRPTNGFRHKTLPGYKRKQGR